MKEILYDIPVNDIFDIPCECPVCAMRKKLEDDSVAFVMGPSYMEDDIRLTTDKIGFCERHMQMMYDFENRLGLALILNTHMQNIIQNIEKLQKKGRKETSGLFSKKTGSSLSDYVKKTSGSCFICDRIRDTFKRYLITTLYLYEKDMAFRKKFLSSRGFCFEHYGMLFEMAPEYLHGQVLEDFTTDLNQIFLSNFKRMQDEVSWFIDKFDYRNADAPWKTSKDALPRAMTKVNGILPSADS
ncbi:MAG: hypothetical protein J1F22_08725 [Lachnospiraceae bacterium]|nr:hypothetical protein [Lachnospiraceae bacterium]